MRGCRERAARHLTAWRVHRYPRLAHDPHLDGVRGGSCDDRSAVRPGVRRCLGADADAGGRRAATAAARQGAAAPPQGRQLAPAGGGLLGCGRDCGPQDLRHRRVHAAYHQGAARPREDRRRAGRVQTAGADAGRPQESDGVVHARARAADGAPRHRRQRRERRGGRRGVHRRCLTRDRAELVRAGGRAPPDSSCARKDTSRFRTGWRWQRGSGAPATWR